MKLLKKINYFSLYALLTGMITLIIFVALRNFEPAMHNFSRLRLPGRMANDLSHAMLPLIISGLVWSIFAYYFKTGTAENKRIQRKPDSTINGYFQSLGFQSVVLFSFIILPRWSDNYWALIFKNDFLGQLNLSIYAIPLTFILASVFIRRQLILTPIFLLAQLNMSLTLLTLYGLLRPLHKVKTGPIFEAIPAVMTATIIWAIFWMVWSKTELQAPCLNIRKTLRYACISVAVLTSWQFISYFWLADNFRQQVAFTRYFSFTRDETKQHYFGLQKEGVCIKNFDRLPQNQQTYLLDKLTETYDKVYTIPADFPPNEHKVGFCSDYKYDLIETNLHQAGLFVSKGRFGSYSGPLAAYYEDVTVVWFLGRWWHIYTTSIVVS